MSEADGMREALIDIIKDTQVDVTTATNSVGPMGRVPYISDEQAAISADAILRLVSLGGWRPMADAPAAVTLLLLGDVDPECGDRTVWLGLSSDLDARAWAPLPVGDFPAPPSTQEASQ